MRSIRVGFDGYNLASPRGTGVATYARTLSHALRGLGYSLAAVYGLDIPHHAPPELRETLFFAALGEEPSGASEKITLRRAIRRAFISPATRDLVEAPITGRVDARAMADRLPAFDRLFSLPGLFPIAARHFRRYRRFMTVRVPDPPAIMHWTYPLPLRLEGAKNLYTLHDLVPLRLPFTSLEDRRYYDRLIRACLATGDHICTVSEASRQDILALFDVPPELVTNTYQAVTPPKAILDLAPDALGRKIRTLFDLDKAGYFLFFGAIEPKKNVGRLIEAYLNADLDTPLVIVGPRAWKAEGELRLLDGAHGVRLRGAERIRRIDYLPSDQLMTLVRGAKAVLFPALCEGFGLPVVEAMSLGAPVLAAASGALPEITGGAALLVDPYDVEALTAAIQRLDQESALRAELGAAGARRAEHFSMAAYQARLADLHRAVLAAPASRRKPSVAAALQTELGVAS